MMDSSSISGISAIEEIFQETGSSEPVDVIEVQSPDYTEALNNIQTGIFMNAFLLAAILGAVVFAYFLKGV